MKITPQFSGAMTIRFVRTDDNAETPLTEDELQNRHWEHQDIFRKARPVIREQLKATEDSAFPLDDGREVLLTDDAGGTQASDYSALIDRALSMMGYRISGDPRYEAGMKLMEEATESFRNEAAATEVTVTYERIPDPLVAKRGLTPVYDYKLLRIQGGSVDYDAARETEAKKPQQPQPPDSWLAWLLKRIRR